MKKIELSNLVNHILVLAQNEGRQSGAYELNPEHVLLAFLKNAEGYGYEMLQNLGVNVLSLQLMLEQFVSGSGVPTSKGLGVLQPSHRLRSVIDASFIESRSMKNNYVGTEHILIGSSLEEGSMMSKFFDHAGITLDSLRQAARQVQEARNFLGEGEEENSEENREPEYAGAKKSGKQKSGAFLEKYTRDLTALAKAGKIDPVIGRSKEIARVVQILSRRTKNNPILLGEPGVGKTAVAEGLACKVASGDVPFGLLGKRVLSLDLTAMVAGTHYRGDFEERMKRMISEVVESKDIILFIDEIHMMIGAGDSSGAMDASNILKPSLSRGEIQVIGATTLKEYRKYIEKDSALERRFQTVSVDEPSFSDAVAIVNGLKGRYEEFHNVVYGDGVIEKIVSLSVRYIHDRQLPDKAIDVMDEAGSAKKIAEGQKNTELLEIEAQIDSLSDEKERLVKSQNFEEAAVARDKVNALREKLDAVSARIKGAAANEKRVVTVSDIERIVSDMTGIPLEQLDSNESKRLLSMEDEIHRMVVGQDEAVRLLSGTVRRSRSGVSSPNRPIGSFIFLGPTGVGKTQLAKSLAKFLFGSDDALIRIDMSEFMDKHTSSRLIGAAPGYIGYDEGGVLTNRVRQKPYSIVLFDEIEKAHEDIFNLMLQILEEGELTDNLGHTVNFRNTVIIMTSNAGAREISAERKLGFAAMTGGTLSHDEMKANAMEELKKIMRPELLNRIDDVVVFDPLTREQVSRILDIQLSELEERVAEKSISLDVSPEARSFLLDRGYNPELGARPMRRIVQSEIEDRLATLILSNAVPADGNVRVALGEDGGLVVG